MTNKMYSCTTISVTLTIALFTLCSSQGDANYYGKFIGSLKQYHHGLQGDVYVVDSRTLHIRNFNYDGEGPAGYFYTSNGKSPNENGVKLRDERGSSAPLKRYRKKHITLTLPEGKTINNIKWFYVWCDEFAVNFGDVKIPKNLDFPKPQKIGKLSGVHAVSSDNIVIVDAQTLLIPAFSYDGEAPDAKFWVGTGTKPTPQGIRVPDENGKTEPLRKYDKKTIVLTLPSDITVFDIGHFAIWCEAFTVDFGHVEIPQDLTVPPSLKMLGVSPQSKLNCEILYDDLAFEARWAVAGDSIVIQLVAKLEKGEYMSFGISGQIDRNTMTGGDVVVAWIDHETLNGFAYDYYLDSKSQCAGNRGSCPDVKLRSNTDSIRLLNAALVNGYSIVTYQRPLRAHDELDLPIFTNGSQAVIWAIGPLNSLQEVSYHSITSKKTTLIDFGRSPQWNCPIPESDASIANSETNENYESSSVSSSPVTETTRIRTESTVHRIRTPTSESREPEAIRTTTKRVEATPAPVKREKPWDIPPIQCDEPDDGIFYAQMGPTGGKRGYPAITGHVGWGTSWYINGLLIPVINVVRGRTYTFVTEGGFDPEIPAKYHPFYITDDPVGGFHYKTPEERAKVRVFAGVMQTKPGEYIPSGVGRLCSWTPDPDQPPADEFASFGAYQRTLSLVCDQGDPGVVQWTPDENTPDTVYYQCFTHRYLGWKINVLDNCDREVASGSEQISSRVRIEDDSSEQVDGELQSRPSIQVVTRVKPSNLSSIANEIPENSKGTPDIYYNSPAVYKDTYKSDYSKTEQLILQDPYLPPPPYQKNFDYQSMQTTEPMKETKPITEKSSDLAADFSKPVKTYINYFPNTSSTIYPTYTPKVKSPYSFRDPYPVYKTPLPLPTSSKHYMPGSHYHIIKHADSAVDRVPAAPLQKSFVVGRPHRHTMVMKKPITKPMPFSYAPRVNKIPKQEPQVAGSIAVKNILAPPLRDTIPKAPQGMLVSYYAPPQQPPPPKKAYYVPSRKREEPKPQYFANNRVEEYAEPKYNGFNPNSIVIEGGFKPIIPNTESQHTQQTQQAQDRMSEDHEEYVEQDLKETASSSTENATTISSTTTTTSSTGISSAKSTEDYSKNPFEGKQPELFEPIFIPSPVINEQEQRKKKPEERPPIDAHKADPNIVYIWPAAETSDAQIKDTRFNGYYSSVNTISSPYYKGAEKGGENSENENIVDTFSSIISKPMSDATHDYKVTEIVDNVNAEVSEMNNATDRIISLSSSDHEGEDDEDTEAGPSNHKRKYIPVSYAPPSKGNEYEKDSRFIITIPEEDSTEMANSTIIKLL